LPIVYLDIYDAEMDKIVARSPASSPVRSRHRVGVLLCPEVSVGSYGLALDVFRMANQLPTAHRFELLRISPDGADVPHGDGSLKADAGLAALPGLRLLVIPSLWTHGRQAVAAHPQVAAALAAMPDDIGVVTMCTGAYFMAAAGRLDGLRVTTHWALADELQKDFPRLEVDPAPNLLAHGAVVCSGGSLAGLDACLHGVQGLSDAATARELARMLVLDPHGPQTAYMPAQGWRRHNDGEVRALQQWMSAHLAEPLTLEAMAAQVHMSVRTLQRRFLAATRQTPMQHLQGLRIDRARELLQSERLAVPEVAVMVGYQDRVAFGRQFKKMTGVTPAAYRQQHRQQQAGDRHPGDHASPPPAIT
jgi:AraC family transcriptional activator FtrA